MKLFKKILLSVLVFIVLSLIGGYFYFDQKFTPEENYLTVENESDNVPITWLGKDKNVLLVPIHFAGDTAKYYVQFDTGSPYTLFYSNSTKNNKNIFVKMDRAETSFNLGNMKISSDKFMIFYNENERKINDSITIIGTLGADILENRKTIINFKENFVAFNVSKEPDAFKEKLLDFKFKKRKIVIEAVIEGKKEKFLYDSGTSAYELLTNKEIWKELKLPKAKVTVEKVQSWENTLISYTAICKNEILFGNKEIPLNEVTYVEGFSKTQYMLMKFSGMTGMLGNKIFLNNCLYIDCTKNKIAIE